MAESGKIRFACDGKISANDLDDWVRTGALVCNSTTHAAAGKSHCILFE